MEALVNDQNLHGVPFMPKSPIIGLTEELKHHGSHLLLQESKRDDLEPTPEPYALSPDSAKDLCIEENQDPKCQLTEDRKPSQLEGAGGSNLKTNSAGSTSAHPS